MGANRSKYRRGSGKEWCLRKYGGVNWSKLPAIEKAEDRQLFKEAMERIGVNVCPVAQLYCG